MTHSTDHTPARDAIALKLRAYFTDVVRDRQDRAWTRADELLNAWAHELAEQQRAWQAAREADELSRFANLDHETKLQGEAVRDAADLIDPKVTT